MSYLHLTRTRTRERTPEYDTQYYRPLVRRDSNKRQRTITLSDDEDDGHDDYPYSSSYKPSKLSRALTIRNQPSQLERYNIWSDRRDKHSDDDEERRRGHERRRTYKYASNRHSHSDDDDKCDPEEREFRLKVQATFSKPSLSSPSHHHHHHDSHFWPGDVFRSSRERWSDEAWETRERSTSRERSSRRRDSVWGDEEKDEEKESWSRYRRIKRTKTEEWRPLSGWRRERIVYGS
ncbi:Nn.00g037120.m01.CDS01 [Neocucurbitaria sp. VM-36]